jgi:hypothetical protein
VTRDEVRAAIVRARDEDLEVVVTTAIGCCRCMVVSVGDDRARVLYPGEFDSAPLSLYQVERVALLAAEPSTLALERLAAARRRMGA